MATIASKNPFDLLVAESQLTLTKGDDGAEPTQPSAPSKSEKSSAKSSVPRGAGRSAPAQESSARAGSTRSRNDAASGNEAAFRDRGAGAERNRTRDTEPRGDYRGRGRGAGRGRGRGGRGGAALDDRHSKTGVSDHEKQVGRGWGEATGDGEWADEQAGEAIAKAETTEDLLAPDGPTEAAEPVEEEPKTKTYDDYLAEQAEKRLNVSSDSGVRKANEGASKKLPTGKEYTREDEEDFIAGSGGKKARDRGKKERNVVELDGEAMRQTDRTSGPERRGGRGGRGGQRGDFEGRGRGRGRGGPEGGRGRGGGEHRGRGDGGFRGRGAPRGGAGNAPNVSDQSAFPTLGA